MWQIASTFSCCFRHRNVELRGRKKLLEDRNSRTHYRAFSLDIHHRLSRPAQSRLHHQLQNFSLVSSEWMDQLTPMWNPVMRNVQQIILFVHAVSASLHTQNGPSGSCIASDVLMISFYRVNKIIIVFFYQCFKPPNIYTWSLTIFLVNLD